MGIPVIQDPFSFGLAEGIGGGLSTLAQALGKRFERQGQQQSLGALGNVLAENPEKQAELLKNAIQTGQITPEVGLPFLQTLFKSQQERITEAAKPKTLPGGLTGQPTPIAIASAIRDVVTRNPNANADELLIQLDEAGIPRTFSNALVESRRRQEETQTKKESDLQLEKRREVLPFKQKLVEKSQAAQEGVENKERSLDIISRNKLDDPTVASLLESLPFSLGKRFLSEDTVQYKAGLVDDFRDLRNIFQGQTRVKEIELLEDKIADIYLTDEQKKAILKSRINTLQADIIRAEVAAEIEEQMPNLGILQFEKELNKRVRPRLKELSNRTIDEYKSVIDQAEKRKKYALDIQNPEDQQIAKQIMIEAGGNKQKAREIAKSKGYKLEGF